MDWGRAKNVLIYAFLLLNLVLGYQLWADVREQADTNLDFATLEDHTKKIMEQKNIQLLCSIPNSIPQLPKITYSYVSGDNIGKPMTLPRPVDSQVVFTDKDIVAALGVQIPQIQNYRYDSVDSAATLSESEMKRVAAAGAAGRFVLHRLIDDKWPLFNDQLELFYNDQKIISYRQSLLEIVPSSDEQPQKIVSASSALKTLVETYIPPGSAIKDIQLGYYGQVFNSEKQVAAPSWRFTLESGEVYYEQGISGDVTVTSPKTEKAKE
ncbi:two-component system regulatory protein YycI [Paenibacillus pini]|uniref:Regulatory protein YycH-like domain-containing protein n=1 Tax=Paenibacillus pini JCM 16418 TaxID=1236976 RepID=W7YBQ1_9BACL|nr:two-component system regulatory protein YycI [Paenibacillus pini]GAF08270.1 hypothetical protein JCM16418_2332 [Paenibacillus pini JCM 16418]